MTSKSDTLVRALVLGSVLGVLGMATLSVAQSGGSKWGTGQAPGALQLKASFTANATSTMSSAKVFTNAQYGSGGVALRNRAGGTLGISGVQAPVQAAFLYWAVITSGPAQAANTKVRISRAGGDDAPSVTVTGTVVGTGPQPCWAGDTITVFKASVPKFVATGNGSYTITLKNGASGSTDGADPWVESPILPLMEGASLVIVGTGTGTVAVYDTGLAGNTFATNPGYSYSLNLPTAATGALTLFDNIGADGQVGTSRTPIAGDADETTNINGVAIAGPGSTAVDSDWNGGVGSPLPQLWDDTGHDITAATPTGTTTLSISIANQGEDFWDCVTPVANVVEVH